MSSVVIDMVSEKIRKTCRSLIEDWVGLLIVSTFSITTMVLVFHHEAWRDEAQAWMLARDLSVVDLFDQMKIEGTPGLWHLILLPFAKAGLPYFLQPLLHWVMIVVSAVLLIYKSPFSRLFSVTVLFSYLFGYEYAVVARSYTLSVFLIFLIAILYNKRMKRPVCFAVLVGLLCNANTHSIGMAAGLGLVFLYDVIRQQKFESRYLVAVGAMLVFGAIAFLQLYPPNDDNYLVRVHMPVAREAFSVLISSTSNALRSGAFDTTIFSLVIFLLVPLPFCRRPQAWLLWVSGFVGLSVVLIVSHSGALRHHGIYVAILLGFIWMQIQSGGVQLLPWTRSLMPSKKLLSAILFVIGLGFVSSFPNLISVYRDDIQYDFSGSKRVNLELRKMGLQDQEVVLYPSPIGSAFLAYSVQRSVWYPEMLRKGSFSIWRKRYEPDLTDSDIVSRIQIYYANRKDFILVINRKLISSLDLFEEIIQPLKPPFTGNGEQYWVYRPIKAMPMLHKPGNNVILKVKRGGALAGVPWDIVKKSHTMRGTVFTVCSALDLSAPAGAVSLAIAEQPGFFLRHRDWNCIIEPYLAKTVYQKDATFMPLEIEGGQKKAFILESINFPGHYIGLTKEGSAKLVSGKHLALPVEFANP